MNSIQQLLELSPAEKTARGLEHTPGEIRQQPEAWRETMEIISAKESKLRGFAAGVVVWTRRFPRSPVNG